MKLLILGENCLLNLSSFDKSIFSTFSLITSIYARQLAAVTPKKYNVIVPEKYKNIDFNENYNAIDIHFKTGTAINAYKIADKFRSLGKIVILSGSHPSALPKEAKKHADSVIIGNVEDLWTNVLKDLESGKLKSFYKQNQSLNEESNISNNIPIPPGLKIIGIVEATQGCPYKCDFCQESNVLFGSYYRTKPIEDVIKEIKSIPQKFLFFCDASLTIDVDYTKALFKSIKKLNKKFVCEGNVDVLAKDEELLKISQDAGCIEWTVGFESFAQQTLKSHNKKTNNIDDYKKVVENIHKYNMAIVGNFIFGFDQDPPDVFGITKENIYKMGLDSARFAILTPYPGTPLFNKLEEEGRIITYNWSKYTRKNVVFKPKNISKEDLQKSFNDITKDFNSFSNIVNREFKSIKLGFYPFLTTIGRNIENYFNKPRN